MINHHRELERKTAIQYSGYWFPSRQQKNYNLWQSVERKRHTTVSPVFTDLLKKRWIRMNWPATVPSTRISRERWGDD